MLSERAKTLKYLQEWSQKTGRPLQELQEELNKKIAEIKASHPSLSDDHIERRARFLVYRELKALMRYPNLRTYDGIFLGFSSAMDVFARRREEAIQAYRMNPEDAVRRGLTRPDGTPIFQMPSGATIDISRPVLLRQSVALGRPAQGGPLKLIVQIHRQDQVNQIPPIGQPVRWSAVQRGETGFRYSTTATRVTKYEPVEMPEIPEVNDEVLCNLLRSAPAELKATCSSLEQWHNMNQGDRERIVIVEGDVVFMRNEPTAIGNMLLVIEDETVMDLEAEGTTVWIHKEISHMLNFGSGSRVIVVGRTVTMPGFDRETRQIDRSVTRIGINAFGIYADPIWRVEPGEEFAIETDVSVGA